MQILKALSVSLLIGSALLPWNATAIDHLEQVKFTGNNNFAANYTENLLVKSLLQITQGQLQQASQTIDQVIQATPNFKLAYLVRGDLLMARAQQLQSFGSAPDSNPDKVSDFRAEARMRLEHYLVKQSPSSIPEPLWQIDASQQYIIVVDADKSRLYLYRNINNQPQYVTDYYVTVGRNGSDKTSEGDKRTPIGVYYADSQSIKKLPDFYGDAAYPLNYPNEWDRHQGNNGHGIWLHGTPNDTYSRPPRASDGCVVLSNPDLKSIGPILHKGKTLYIVANNMQWVSPDQAATQKMGLTKAVEDWRKDWQSQDTDAYLSHYSNQFFTRSTNLDGWSKEKRR